MSARAEILGRIRGALTDRPAVADVPREYRSAGQLDLDDVVGLFAERVADYRATVHRCAPSDLADLVARRLDEAKITSLVVDDGLPREWLAATTADVTVDEAILNATRLDAIDAVVTSCRCGIAVTGTIVLDHTSGQGRRALSLIPDHHLVVIRADQIVANVPDAIALLDATRPQTWISGPSATSDIELSRVEGVHGPRTLEVVIVDSSGEVGDRPL